ncbi:MAG: hypothetical protein WCG36_04325, partial [bacterium]
MKPSNAKPRKDMQNPLQMDFLSAIPHPPRSLAPVEPGPDGTPPLPLSNAAEPTPLRSIFPKRPPVSYSDTMNSPMEGFPMPTNHSSDDDVFE